MDSLEGVNKGRQTSAASFLPRSERGQGWLGWLKGTCGNCLSDGGGYTGVAMSAGSPQQHHPCSKQRRLVSLEMIPKIRKGVHEE